MISLVENVQDVRNDNIPINTVKVKDYKYTWLYRKQDLKLNIK